MDLSTLEELEETFQALSNINRLKLLLELRRPRGYNEIELTPSRPTRATPEDSPISRQAVRNHIQELRDLGVVVETESDGRRRRFVLDGTKLYAIVDQVRKLAELEPAVDPAEATLDPVDEPQLSTPQTPHLALVRGVQEGRTFPLDPDGGTSTIGREAGVDVRLDYDAYVSSEHALVLHGDEGNFLLQDLEENEEGTSLNWGRLESGTVAPLSAGDVIGVGRSLLVFRD